MPYVRIEYNTFTTFQYNLKAVLPYPLIDDEKAGITRKLYYGIVKTKSPPSNNMQTLVTLFITPQIQPVHNSLMNQNPYEPITSLLSTSSTT